MRWSSRDLDAADEFDVAEIIKVMGEYAERGEGADMDELVEEMG